MNNDLVSYLNYQKYRRRCFLTSKIAYYIECIIPECESMFKPKELPEEYKEEWVLSGLCPRCQDKIFDSNMNIRDQRC